MRWLVDQRDLGLVVRAGKSGLGRDIRWVHSIELADPTPWVHGGELLLTTGIRLPRSASEQRRYVRRLASAGVTALGFGVGLTFDTIPEQVVDAAEELGLPLLEVPLATPFIAVTKTLADRLARLQYEGVVRASEVQPAMTRAALRGGPAAVVRELAIATDAAVVLLDTDGEVVAAYPAAAADVVDELIEELTRSGRADASAVSIEPGGVVAMQPVRVGSRVHGRLVLRSKRELSHVDHLLLGHGVSLIALEQEKPRRLRKEQAGVNATILGLLRDGSLTGQAARQHLATAGFPVRGGACVLAVEAPSPSRVLAAVDAVLAERGLTLFGIETDDCAIVLLPGAGTRLAEEVAARIRPTFRSAPNCGYAALGTLNDITTAVKRAVTAARVARSRGVPVVDFASLAGQALISAPETRAVLADLAELRLRPLADLDARRGTDLVPTLRAFLEHNGHWESAAQALGVHRHTLRNRVARVEEVLGVDLGSAHVRAELLLALLAWQES